MNTEKSIGDIFCENCAILDEEYIIKLSRSDNMAHVNNVVVRLNKHCFGLLAPEETKPINYHLFYVNGEKKLEGYLLNLSINNPKRDELVFYFSNYLSHNYSDLDTIDVFNTFQDHTRTFLEKIEYLTFLPSMFEKYGDPNPAIMAKGVKGIIPIPMINKVEFYKAFFGVEKSSIQADNENVIYLMLNSRNTLIKIGKSKIPNFREKTLQSEEPEVVLIKTWKAPSSVERELHKKFDHKRERGEWFNLNFKELKEIKERMKVYEDSNN